MPRVNPRALHIVVADELMGSEAIKALEAQGHTISSFASMGDVIIGPRCWRIDPHLKLGDDKTEEESLKRQLEIMKKGVRAIKYLKEIKHEG